MFLVVMGKSRNKVLYRAISHADGSVSEMTFLHDDHKTAMKLSFKTQLGICMSTQRAPLCSTQLRL